MSLESIIERLEKGETGREVDRAIWFALHHETDYAKACEAPPGAFSTSIDAALTLVPEGWMWNASSPDLSGRAFAYVREYQPDKPRPMRPDAEGSARVPSPAVAMCIAALKARQATAREAAR